MNGRRQFHRVFKVYGQQIPKINGKVAFKEDFLSGFKNIITNFTTRNHQEAHLFQIVINDDNMNHT